MRERYIRELLSAVTAEVQKKYCSMNEVYRLTKELGEGLSNDDKLVVHMMLEMRGKELEKMKDCDICIERLIPGASEDIREKLHVALKGTVPGHVIDEKECAMWKQITDTTLATKRIWKQTVEVDRVLSRRLAGSDSYYCQAKEPSGLQTGL